MPQEFYQRVPGERHEQVERRAKIRSRIASLFEKQIEWQGPGDVNVDPRMTVPLSGTGSAWDQSYIIQSITFIFDQPEGVSEYGGFTMTIEAANDIGGMQAALDSTTTQPADTSALDNEVGSPAQSPSGWDEKGFE